MSASFPLFQRRIHDLTIDIVSFMHQHEEMSDQFLEEYIARFDAVLHSVGWNDNDLLTHIDGNWHTGD